MASQYHASLRGRPLWPSHYGTRRMGRNNLIGDLIAICDRNRQPRELTPSIVLRRTSFHQRRNRIVSFGSRSLSWLLVKPCSWRATTTLPQTILARLRNISASRRSRLAACRKVGYWSRRAERAGGISSSRTCSSSTHKTTSHRQDHDARIGLSTIRSQRNGRGSGVFQSPC